MFYVEIRTDSGREIQFSRDSYVYLREPDDQKHLWKWQDCGQRSREVNHICDKARSLAADIEAILPDLQMSLVR